MTQIKAIPRKNDSKGYYLGDIDIEYDYDNVDAAVMKSTLRYRIIKKTKTNKYSAWLVI